MGIQSNPLSTPPHNAANSGFRKSYSRKIPDISKNLLVLCLDCPSIVSDNNKQCRLYPAEGAVQQSILRKGIIRKGFLFIVFRTWRATLNINN